MQQFVHPHSHPVLTMNARPGEDDRILATYLHEQIHWFTAANLERDALAELLGRERADWVVDGHVERGYYPFMYTAVMRNTAAIAAVASRHGLTI